MSFLNYNRGYIESIHKKEKEVPSDFHEIDVQLKRAKAAQSILASYSQEKLDEIIQSLAWAIYRDDHAKELAILAVNDTGLGNIDDKITKNKRKTLGTLIDLLPIKTVGIVKENPEIGLTTFNKPIGIVGTLTPSTNPAATPANQALMAVKGGNAIIVCPSPSGLRTAQKLKEYFDEALQKINVPTDIFQIVDAPINFSKAEYLSRNVDLILVTGDQKNVKKGYSSGTPCIGVGKGNVPVIVDKSANIAQAIPQIISSKIFDNSTSCSSENSLIIDQIIYQETIKTLERAGAYIASPNEIEKIEKIMFSDNKLNCDVVGQSLKDLGEIFQIAPEKLFNKKVIIVEQSGIGPDHPLSGEKMSLILSVYKAHDFDNAIEIANGILKYEGIGHSVGVHTSNMNNARKLAAEISVTRVLVNQAHTFGNGGGFNNALPFTLTMGCGSWAGNSISENLSINDFVNKTKLVETYNKENLSAAEAFSHLYDHVLDT